MRYDLNRDGTLGPGQVFFDAKPLADEGRKGLPDGLKTDLQGNVFATGPGGVLVLSPAGQLLGIINTGEAIANCAWGNDGSVLYLTSHGYLCRIKTWTRGFETPVPSRKHRVLEMGHARARRRPGRTFPEKRIPVSRSREPRVGAARWCRRGRWSGGGGQTQLVVKLVLQPEPALLERLGLLIRCRFKFPFNATDPPVHRMVVVDQTAEFFPFLFQFQDQVAMFSKLEQQRMMEVHRTASGRKR
jgi:hypothetical protein